MSDHYQTLGIEPSATTTEIRSAYRTLVKTYHPDANPHEGAEPVFLAVQEAYSVLSDPARKSHYDESLRLQERITARKMEEQQAAKSKRDEESRAKADAESKRRFLARKAKTDALRQALSAGRYGEAESIAEDLLKEKFNDPASHSVIADMARVRGNFRKAAKHYAYAFQFDPGNAGYMRLHEEMTAAAERAPDRSVELVDPGPSPFPVLTGVFVVLVGAVYSGLAIGVPLVPDVAFLSTVTLAQVTMFVLAGTAIGASMSAGNLLGPFDLGGSSTVHKIHPAVALGSIACVSFWAALVVYWIVGVSQRAFNPSLSKLFAAVSLAVGAFSLARFGSGNEAVVQTLLWSGNVVYAGSALGWLVADGIRSLRVRS